VCGRSTRSLGIFVTMSKDLRKYQVRAPQLCVGHVIGELCRIGSWVDGSSIEPPTVTIHARVPVDAVPEFEQWLTKITGGEGAITGGDAANDEDA
jgi:hypothetical protein